MTRVMTLGGATEDCGCGGGLKGIRATPRKPAKRKAAKRKPTNVKGGPAKRKKPYCIKVGDVTTRCFSSKTARDNALKKRNKSGTAKKRARAVTKKK